MRMSKKITIRPAQVTLVTLDRSKFTTAVCSLSGRSHSANLVCRGSAEKLANPSFCWHWIVDTRLEWHLSELSETAFS